MTSHKSPWLAIAFMLSLLISADSNHPEARALASHADRQVKVSDTAKNISQPKDSPELRCNNTSLGYPPLTDLGTGTYQGYEGGLYPFGSNQPPLDYRWMGRAHAERVRPLNANGQPDPDGKIVLLSIGMSNATIAFSEFKRQADGDPKKNPQVMVVDGAIGGYDANRIRDPGAPYWRLVDQRLSDSGVTPNQVQVVWLKEAIVNGGGLNFPANALALRDALRDIVGVIEGRYPNLQIVHLASLSYGGYILDVIPRAEPYSYETAFADKWLIEERVLSDGSGAWVGWGPYFWTDGLKGRDDGFVWRCEYNVPDGHPSPLGAQAMAGLMLDFYKTDETARGWFVRP
jgi:hypothetical protein